jgi:hypothetical protein
MGDPFPKEAALIVGNINATVSFEFDRPQAGMPSAAFMTGSLVRGLASREQITGL